MFSVYVFSPRVERDRPPHCVEDVPLPLDDVRPRRRAGVLEVRHEDLRARVERVDHHLAVDRPGDLDPAVLEVGRRRPDAPVAFADRSRLGEEVRPLAGVEPRLPLGAGREQLEPFCAEFTLEALDEAERLRRQDVLACGSEDLRHACVNCASSVEPFSASVELSPPVTASSTLSK